MVLPESIQLFNLTAVGVLALAPEKVQMWIYCQKAQGCVLPFLSLPHHYACHVIGTTSGSL